MHSKTSFLCLAIQKLTEIFPTASKIENFVIKVDGTKNSFPVISEIPFPDSFLENFHFRDLSLIVIRPGGPVIPLHSEQRYQQR